MPGIIESDNLCVARSESWLWRHSVAVHQLRLSGRVQCTYLSSLNKQLPSCQRLYIVTFSCLDRHTISLIFYGVIARVLSNFGE